MARKRRTINVPAPYPKRVWLDPSRIADRKAYPFCLPLLHNDFDDRAITIILGENGVGKSTLLEGIAVLAVTMRLAAAKATCRSTTPTRAK